MLTVPGWKRIAARGVALEDTEKWLAANPAAISFRDHSASCPDKSLRIWMGTTDGREVLETGTYLIMDASGVQGGVGRLMDKLENKAVTWATGFDQDIDPEGWGYKQMKETDTITLKDGVVRLKIE